MIKSFIIRISFAIKKLIRDQVLRKEGFAVESICLNVLRKNPRKFFTKMIG